MNYTYEDFPIKGRFTLTDFNCASFDKRLGTGDYYKIIWANHADVCIGIDGYKINLKKNHLLFCTPLNMIHLEPFIEGVTSFIFDREFYCIRDHDHEVSCNGFLFLGSSIPPMVELSEKDQKSFELLLMLFKEEFETADHIQGEMLRVLLKRLLIKSVRLLKKTLIEPELNQTKIDTITRFNLLVEEHFRENHIPLKNLSRVLEDCGTLVNPLVPWGVCGAFFTAALGVSVWDYAPYAFFLFLSPLFTILLGFVHIDGAIQKKP